jgi:uncharacterized protein YbaP (TraB family)
MTLHIFRLVFASTISVFLLSTFSAKAQTVVQETDESNGGATTQNVGAFTTGLLWKIETPASSPSVGTSSYLFGTMHSDDPRIAVVPEEVQQALTVSESFCMEMLADMTAMMTMSKIMLFTNGNTLQAIVGEQLFEQLTPLMRKRGIPAQALTMFKPWAVYLTLSVPPQKTGRFLDLVLYESAKQQNKPVCGLETAEEQVDVFERTPLEDQILLLQQIVKDPGALDKQLEQLTEKYLTRDIAGLIALSQEFDAATFQEQESTKAFLRRLIDDRNVRMVERMLPRLKQGSAFIAIGALHLPGEKGILQLLTERGYTVSVAY